VNRLEPSPRLSLAAEILLAFTVGAATFALVAVPLAATDSDDHPGRDIADRLIARRDRDPSGGP
jgi:hypothetical protein